MNLKTSFERFFDENFYAFVLKSQNMSVFVVHRIPAVDLNKCVERLFIPLCK